MRAADRWLLWAAQGFGAGRAPAAPGTFGSVIGLLWTAILLAPQSWTVFVVGNLAGVAASVWLCGAAERILQSRDPGSVVLDEIVAIPLCFAAWTVSHQLHTGHLLAPRDLVSGHAWVFTLGIFAAFRLFDIWKPWPVRQSQSLPGGWGVTADDCLAAGYVNLVSLLFVR